MILLKCLISANDWRGLPVYTIENTYTRHYQTNKPIV